MIFKSPASTGLVLSSLIFTKLAPAAVALVYAKTPVRPAPPPN